MSWEVHGKADGSEHLNGAAVRGREMNSSHSSVPGDHDGGDVGRFECEGRVGDGGRAFRGRIRGRGTRGMTHERTHGRTHGRRIWRDGHRARARRRGGAHEFHLSLSFPLVRSKGQTGSGGGQLATARRRALGCKYARPQIGRSNMKKADCKSKCKKRLCSSANAPPTATDSCLQ
jgi:hypothetical protein